ncbi:DMT family transporter [Microvirga thermotolerans]|uniref:EamA family transporter n=1 Tax=Microvirga thermotolerans TaxID=2651334 RepID=A0A5P9JUF5_9HYPH|nr:DMT family transporter [Microvirga thermotolerans]QFU16462.1 EamA family transporter [Microvirga thermotolerans]
MTLRDFSLMFMVCLTWASHTIVSKLVVSGMEIPPLFYATIRYVIVALVTVPWLMPVPLPRWRMALVGFLMGGGGFALFFLGIKTATPSSAAIVSQLGLPMTALLSVAMLGERIHWKRGIGIALTFVGGLIVMWNPREEFPISGGLVFILGSAFVGSLAAVMMKQIKGVKPLQFQAWVGLASALPLIVLTASFESGQMTKAAAAGWPFVMAVLFSALVVSLLSHTTYYDLIRKYPANLIAPLLIMNPLITVVLGIVITGDRFDMRMAVGSALALCGILIITLGEARTGFLLRVLRKHLR